MRRDQGGSSLPEAAAFDLHACYRPRRFADRDVIFHSGDEPDYLFQVAVGNVALCNYSVDRQDDEQARPVEP